MEQQQQKQQTFKLTRTLDALAISTNEYRKIRKKYMPNENYELEYVIPANILHTFCSTLSFE